MKLWDNKDIVLNEKKGYDALISNKKPLAVTRGFLKKEYKKKILIKFLSVRNNHKRADIDNRSKKLLAENYY